MGLSFFPVTLRWVFCVWRCRWGSGPLWSAEPTAPDLFWSETYYPVGQDAVQPRIPFVDESPEEAAALDAAWEAGIRTYLRRVSHMVAGMNLPDEALRAWEAIVAEQPGHECPLLPIHWGTFQLTDEAMDEPPRRVREKWTWDGRNSGLLWLLRHGETRMKTR